MLSILAGAAVGLLYGWMVNPVRYVNTTPENLRSDFQADYVLMVAEIYSSEKDATLAARRLLVLGDTQPLRSVQQAIITGQGLGYSQQDLAQLGRLSQAIETWTPAGGSTP